MRVSVDPDRCQSHGQCEFVAPAVFTVNDDGDLEYDDAPGETHREPVERAVRRCPAQAIRIES